MRVTACICWYDESPEFIYRAARSLEGVADRLVTLDGAWRFFEPERVESSAEAREALHEGATDAGLPHEALRGERVWETQVEKRGALYETAINLTKPDWLFVLDGDEKVVESGEDFRYALARTERHVAAVSVRNLNPAKFEKTRRHRRFFRAVPGLTVTETHNGVVIPDGYGGLRWLAGPRRVDMEPALDLSGSFFIDHPQMGRGDNRNRRSRAYYATRASKRIEVA